MSAWRRWQDYATIILGVVLFLTPFVFGDTSRGTATTTAYILGVLLVLGGLLAAAVREPNQVEWIPVILGVITFVSPFVFGFTAVTAIAWAAWIVGVLTGVSAGSLLLGVNRRPTLA
jgi:uncharacterized membrane protein HdeD (DUF308 family)